jgi:5-methylcytosine-specific restriction endonuclease McrA
MIQWSFPTHHVARSLSMSKLTLHDMPRVAQAQMLAALRHALWLPPGGHGVSPVRTSSPGWSKRVSTEGDFFLPNCKDQQEFTASMHQVDHVIAEKHGGQTVIENLALSCTV